MQGGHAAYPQLLLFAYAQAHSLLSSLTPSAACRHLLRWGEEMRGSVASFLKVSFAETEDIVLPSPPAIDHQNDR
ncbi:hypothetical protein Rleg5DRAFT_2840 [Rhizobium leguminosarum bv. viciae WSM1455]|nr:hypothetical protein Rleg5DRAFT_2840 [Rhizobium leguminosarum bv. viciae WSM1455]